MASWQSRDKRFVRVEDRKDYVEPIDVENLLDTLETTGVREGVLSPKHINSRLVLHYNRYQVADSQAERKDCMNKAWNLALPIVYQVIEKKFKRTLDLYAQLRPDIICDCSIVVARTFKSGRYDASRAMLSSYLYEFFVYAILGCTGKFFKDKKKYICVDPHVMNQTFVDESDPEDLRVGISDNQPKGDVTDSSS